MPVLSALIEALRAIARRRPGDRAGLAALVAASSILGACIAEDGLPTARPSVASPSATPPPATAPTARTSDLPPTAPAAPAGSPSPIADLLPVEVRVEAVTVICEAWGADPPPSTIACGDAVSLALGALGGDQAASVRRLSFHYGEPCETAPCAGRRPDAAWVLARSDAFDSLVVRLEVGSDGALHAWPPIDGPVVPDPPFAAPPPSAPELAGVVPSELRDRAPLAFCGDESLADPDAFDRTARTCFLAGVLAGVPVELVSRTASTEGGVVTTVFRFLGRGGVLRYVGSAGHWVVSACGISPIPTTAVFLMAGPCQARDL